MVLRLIPVPSAIRAFGVPPARRRRASVKPKGVIPTGGRYDIGLEGDRLLTDVKGLSPPCLVRRLGVRTRSARHKLRNTTLDPESPNVESKSARGSWQE